MRRQIALLLLLAAGPAAGQDASDTGYSLPPLGDLRGVAERPLFMQGRRGAVESQSPVVAPATATAAVAPLTLAGIGRRSDGQGVALLRQGGTARTLSPGQEWVGWRLVAVGTASVEMLSPQGERQSLRVGQSLFDPDSK